MTEIAGSSIRFRGMDPRIQIRIHTKMSWIRNTGARNYPILRGVPVCRIKPEVKSEQEGREEGAEPPAAKRFKME
jgi:hypothetical protein